MIKGNGAARELFTRGYRYIFAVLSTSDQYLTPAIDLAAEHANEFGKSKNKLRVALAMENDPFAQDVRAGVLDDVRRNGMMVVIDDRLPPDLNDMSVTLTKVKALKPDVLVVSGQEKGALTAVNQIKALQVYVPVVALTHCDSAQIAEELGDAAEHVFCAHTARSVIRTSYSARRRISPRRSRRNTNMRRPFKPRSRRWRCMSLSMRSSVREVSILGPCATPSPRRSSTPSTVRSSSTRPVATSPNRWF